MATIDDLNTQVAGLSTNVADLLAAVNVQKSYIDGAEALAAAQVALATTQATNAAASYDSFDDRYLGAKALAPTLDNDGNALLTGALYFNTAVNSWNAWNGSAWVSAPAPVTSGSTVSNTPAGSISATTVQAAIDELASEKVQATTLAASGGAALVGNTPSGTTSSTTVQAAINEIALDVEGKVNSHGFPINSSGNYLCTLTYNETTRTVTVTPTASTFDVYVKGIKYTKTGAQSIVHSATGTGFFIYYDDTGTLISTTTVWDETQVAPVAYVFQDVTNSRRICFEERHHAESNVYWHRNQHINEGTKASGTISATGYTLLDGSTDAAVTFGINTLRIEDEDIRIDTQALPDNGPYTILERAGASGDWRITRTNTLPFLFSGNVLQYNQNNAGTWQRTNLAEDNFVNYYVFGIPSLPTTDITPAPTTTQQIVIIAGQATYATQSLASAETFASISWGTVPFQELVPLFQYTLRYNASNPAAYSNTARCAIQTFTRTVGTAAQITQAAQVDHGSLIGLSDLDHPASAIINTPAGNIAATDVQSAINELDTEKAALSGATFSGPVSVPAGATGTQAPQAQEVYQKSSILGTVTQSGGTPTGAIIESGNNANGEYVKYANGTMICTKHIIVGSVAHPAAGSVFKSAAVAAGNWPVTFTALYGVTCTGTNSVGGGWIAQEVYPTVVGAGSYSSMHYLTGSASWEAYVVGVGRWF